MSATGQSIRRPSVGLNSGRSTTARWRRSRPRRGERRGRSSEPPVRGPRPGCPRCAADSRAVSRVRPAVRELDQRITRSVAERQSPDTAVWLLGRHRHIDRRRWVLDHQDGHRMRSTVPGDVDQAFAALPWKGSAVARGEAEGDINLRRVGGQPAGLRCWPRDLPDTPGGSAGASDLDPLAHRLLLELLPCGDHEQYRASLVPSMLAAPAYRNEKGTTNLSGRSPQLNPTPAGRAGGSGMRAPGSAVAPLSCDSASSHVNSPPKKLTMSSCAIPAISNMRPALVSHLPR
jgi:hypothetical protein